jgi:hypothetical protein
MPLVSVQWQPSHRQLRQFGILAAIALPGIAWLWSLGSPWIVGCALLGVGLAVAAGWAPRLVKPIFIGLMLVTFPIGLVLSELVLILVYWSVFVPMGLAFRLLRRDRLQRTLERQRDSYWQVKQQPRSLANYYRQS